MAKILIIYYSKTGNTKAMAEYVSQGVKKAGAEVIMKSVEGAKVEEMLKADGIILGSPTYYGHSSGVMRSFIDKSVKLHGKLEGKVGGAFASSANIGGGNETTVLDIIHAMLIHGMIVQGLSNGDHYGPVSIGEPGDRTKDNCIELGRTVAELANKLN
jgi:NAD(P)H dehydrogenase (quinone)